MYHEFTDIYGGEKYGPCPNVPFLVHKCPLHDRLVNFSFYPVENVEDILGYMNNLNASVRLFS